MRIVSGIPLAVALLAVTATAAHPQEKAWQNRWYWGAQGGALMFQTPTQTWETAASVGGHWFITKDVAGLYLAFDEVLFKSNTTSAVVNPSAATGLSTVNFSRGQRWQAILYAIPGGDALQIHLGGGFAIHHLTDAAVAVTGTETAAELQTAATAVETASSDAFFVVAAGFQLRFGRWALYTDYQYMPASNDFLITSAQHAFIGGLRFALTSSRTEVGTR